MFDYFRLSVAQLLLGLLIFGCQVAPAYWQFEVGSYQNVQIGIAYANNVMDVILPGVWSGLVVSNYIMYLIIYQRICLI